MVVRTCSPAPTHAQADFWWYPEFMKNLRGVTESARLSLYDVEIERLPGLVEQSITIRRRAGTVGALRERLDRPLQPEPRPAEGSGRLLSELSNGGIEQPVLKPPEITSIVRSHGRALA